MISPKIAVLITCHNRKENTLHCLHELFVQQGLGIDFSLQVFLVDDGSTDGTTSAIKVEYPSVVIITGTGYLYWNRGMRLAWQHAAEMNEFDYFLWLNDDTYLNHDAIRMLLIKNCDNGIIIGSTFSYGSNEITYGGFSQITNRLIVPNGELQKCDYFNGNCVLIPKKVFELIGNLDSCYQHALGDFDYGLRAKKLGIQSYVASQFIGVCEPHDDLPKWMSPSVKLRERILDLYSPLSGCYPPEFFLYDRRHKGLMVACFHYFTIHLTVIFPCIKNLKCHHIYLK